MTINQLLFSKRLMVLRRKCISKNCCLLGRIKGDFSFNPEGITKPIHLSFFGSPSSNEEEFNAVLLRVFDKEIDRVIIVEGGNTIHNFKLFTNSSGEKFGLFRTKSDEIYDAEYIAHDSEGEVVYCSKQPQ